MNEKQKFYSIIGIKENGAVLECRLVSGLPRKLAITYLRDWKKYQPMRYDRYVIREDK